MTVTLSPIHPCARCGAPVQTAERPFGRTRLEDPATGQRHECAPLPPVRLLGLRECPECEKADVFEFDGAYYLAECVTLPMKLWRRHVCKAEPPAPTPPAPVKVEMAETGPRTSLRLDPNYG